MSANPTLSNHHLHHNTPQKVIAKIQQKPSSNNFNQFKVVNVNPSPSKPPLIAARPLAPLLPAAPTTATPLNHHPSLAPPTKPLKKPRNDSVQLGQHQQQQQVRPGHPTATATFTQDQLNQIAAALQQKNGQNGHSIGSFANGQFYQFIPIQPNGVKLQQPLIIAPCSSQLLSHSKNSNIQPKPAQAPHPQPQTPAGNGDAAPHSQFLFQSVGHKANAAGSVPAQAVAAPVQHQLSATSTNIQMLQQRLAEEEHRQEQLLKQLNEKKHQAKAKSPDKKAKCDAMDVDEWSHDDANSVANSSGVHSKKRGRPRLYAVDALTGKSIKGKLIENKQKSPKVAQQSPAQLQFAIYPSPSTSASSSSYSQQQQQQQNFIINQPAQFNPQFIPLNIVQPMIQEEKNEPAAQQQTTQASTQPEQQNCSKSSEPSGDKEVGEMSVSGQTSVSESPEREDKKLVDTLKNLKSKVVLTHVIDGFVIKESSEPFPVKAGEVQRMCVEQRTPPKSTSTPCNAIKREDQLNTSRLLDDNSLLNTSATSQKSKAKSRPKQSPKKPRTDELDDTSAAAQPNAAAASVCRQEWPSGDPTEWNCEQVYAFVVLVAGEQVAEMFRSQDMDGSALSLIRDDHLVNTMGVKLGPALKIMSKFNEFKIKFSQSL